MRESVLLNFGKKKYFEKNDMNPLFYDIQKANKTKYFYFVLSVFI